MAQAGISESKLELDVVVLPAATWLSDQAPTAQETEGWVVISHFKRMTASDFDHLAPTSEDLTVRSTLASDDALASLEEFEAARRSSA